ncbi:MAG: hypothetical protein ACRDP5_04675 [Streptosporangiaceae bacterium]
MRQIPPGIHFSWPDAGLAICGDDIQNGAGELTHIALETTCPACLAELAACGEWPEAADKLRILYAPGPGPVHAAPAAAAGGLLARPQRAELAAIAPASSGRVQVLRRRPGGARQPRRAPGP